MAGGYELAKAYVSVIASTKGAGAQIIAEMGSAGDSAGAKAAAGFGSKFGPLSPGWSPKHLEALVWARSLAPHSARALTVSRRLTLRRLSCVVWEMMRIA